MLIQLKREGSRVIYQIYDLLDNNPVLAANPLLAILLLIVICFVICIGLLFFVFIWAQLIRLVLKANTLFFNKLKKEKGNTIAIEFTSTIMGVVIVLLMVLAPFATKGVERAIIGSTTVIAAVIGIAAKDVIGDMIAGLQISVHKPFDLGDRIQLEDGTTGIVKTINLRSVTISGLDSLCFEIPNRRINEMIVLNYSYGDIPRSLKFEYPVAYDTDIEKAKKIIREAVDKSPYSIEIDQPESDLPDFGTVYFLSIESSAIILGVLVYFPGDIRAEILKDDINSRVFTALKDNGIEIPYNYETIIVKQDEKEAAEVKAAMNA